ncbi:hypothetical protein ABPG74_005890 [Tetrahymena malaccensis]
MEIEIEEIPGVLQNRNQLNDLQKCDIKTEDITYLIPHIMKFNQNLAEVQLDSYNLTSVVLKAKNTIDNSCFAIFICDIKKQNYQNLTTKNKKLGLNLLFECILDNRLLFQTFDYNQYYFASKTLLMSEINEQNFTLVKSALVKDEQLDEDLQEIVINSNVVEKLQKCLKLEKLNLDLNFLQKGQQYVSTILMIETLSFNLTDLKIGLIQSGIQDTQVKQIAEALVQYKKLQNLELLLSQNPISEQSIYQLLSSISQLSNLESVVLDFFELQKPICISGDDSEIQQNQTQISNSIKNLKIDFSHNKYLSQHFFQNLINQSLSFTNNLTDYYLDLSENPISSQLFGSIIQELSKQTQLRSLNLRLVNVKLELPSFQDSFVKLTEVEKFVIQLDQPISSCLKLFEGIQLFKKLKYLEVRIKNYTVTQIESSEIPFILKQLNSLQYLVLIIWSQEVNIHKNLFQQRSKQLCLKARHLVKARLHL